jgi:hypothetical protein
VHERSGGAVHERSGDAMHERSGDAVHAQTKVLLVVPRGNVCGRRYEC